MLGKFLEFNYLPSRSLQSSRRNRAVQALGLYLVVLSSRKRQESCSTLTTNSHTTTLSIPVKEAKTMLTDWLDACHCFLLATLDVNWDGDCCPALENPIETFSTLNTSKEIKKGCVILGARVNSGHSGPTLIHYNVYPCVCFTHLRIHISFFKKD